MTQQDTSNPGVLWSALMIISWHRWSRSSKADTLLDLKLTSKEEVRVMKAQGSPGCSDHELVEFKIPIEENKATCGITVSWSSGQQMLAFPGICLEESCRRWSSREESRIAGWLPGITFSSLKNGSCQQTGNQAKVAGCLYGWTRSFWVNTNRKRKHSGSGSRVRWSRSNTESVS